jgi:hypothetical protein
MEEGNVAVLVDAKAEYTKQLVNILRPCIYQGIKSLYEESKEMCEQDNNPNNVLMSFQEMLSRIPKWSQDLINKEYNRIVDSSQCDWIEDLITAVFVSHTKVLTIVHQGRKNKKINLKIPKPSHFMHLCYIESARQFWKNPYLFSERVGQFEYQRNMRDAEGIISDAVTETIRQQLPVRHILKEYLGDSYQSEPEEEDDIKQSITKKQKNNLKRLVKKELENSEGSISIEDEGIIREFIRQELKTLTPPKNENADIKSKAEVIDEVIEEVKEETNAEVKEETNEEVKEETNAEVKEETNAEVKEETNEEVNEETNEEVKEETNEEVKEDALNNTETTTENTVETTTENTVETTVDNKLEMKVEELTPRTTPNVEPPEYETVVNTTQMVESSTIPSDTTTMQEGGNNFDTSTQLREIIENTQEQTNQGQTRSRSDSVLSMDSNISNESDFKISELDDIELDLENMSDLEGELTDIDLEEESESKNTKQLVNEDKSAFSFFS